MATQVPNRSAVRFIVNFLKACGGRAKSTTLARSYEMAHDRPMVCVASFVADCRKLGADIQHDKSSGSLTLRREPFRDRPVQRDFSTLPAAVHFAEEWMGRTRRGQFPVEAVKRLVEAVRKHEDIPPHAPVPERPEPERKSALKSYRLFD
jgi:hypothetical protein